MFVTTGFIDAIDRHLDRLGLSADPYSGVSTSGVQDDLSQVKIFDDYDSGIYSAEAVADYLKGAEALTLEQFWQGIQPFEA
jgi:hypothetical protein